MTSSRPFRPHCCYCLSVDVELVADRNSLTGAVTLWCADVCLQAVLAMELELREHLLDEAREDDRVMFLRRDCQPVIVERVTPHWQLGAALEELRLVERRIYQLRELLPPSRKEMIAGRGV